MKTLAKINVAALAAVGALASLAAAPASAAEATDVSAQETVVVARSDIGNVPVHIAPYPDAEIVNATPPGGQMLGLCWTEGGFVSDWGVAHDHWVRVENGTANDLWVWGGGLVGDMNGNVPNHC
jgi:hypothetical protein